MRCQASSNGPTDMAADTSAASRPSATTTMRQPVYHAPSFSASRRRGTTLVKICDPYRASRTFRSSSPSWFATSSIIRERSDWSANRDASKVTNRNVFGGCFFSAAPSMRPTLDFPAPQGPKSATLWPGDTCTHSCASSSATSLYAKRSGWPGSPGNRSPGSRAPEGTNSLAASGGGPDAPAIRPTLLPFGGLRNGMRGSSSEGTCSREGTTTPAVSRSRASSYCGTPRHRPARADAVAAAVRNRRPRRRGPAPQRRGHRLPGKRARTRSKGGDVDWLFFGAGSARLLPRLIAGRRTGPVFLSSLRPSPARVDVEAAVFDIAQRRVSILAKAPRAAFIGFALAMPNGKWKRLGWDRAPENDRPMIADAPDATRGATIIAVACLAFQRPVEARDQARLGVGTVAPKDCPSLRNPRPGAPGTLHATQGSPIHRTDCRRIAPTVGSPAPP